MKKILLCLLVLLCVNCYAMDSVAYILGMRNNHYVFVGLEYGEKWGLVVENSFFTQGFEKQYVGVGTFYEWNAFRNINGLYYWYAGRSYDGTFYDVGVQTVVYWTWFDFIQWKFLLNPFYDSFFKVNNGYELLIQMPVLEEINFFGGVKNLPYYRKIERRIACGAMFKTGSIWVKPEFSVPMNGDTHLTRVEISFVYKRLI